MDASTGVTDAHLARNLASQLRRQASQRLCAAIEDDAVAG